MYISDMYVRGKNSKCPKIIVYDISTVSFMIQADVMIWPHPEAFSIKTYNKNM